MTTDVTTTSVPDHDDSNDLQALLSSFVSLLPIDEASASTLTAPFDIETLVAGSPTAAALSEAQIDLGDGPAWTALRTRSPVQVRLDVAEDRAAWPFLTASPAASGLRFILAVPLTFGPLTVGAVTLSSTEAVEMSDEQLRLAETLATVLGRAVIARSLAEAQGGDVSRDPALSRREVHQATGMVLAQLGTTPGDALLAIRAYAYGRGVSVREVAGDIIARRIDFSSDRPDDRK